MERARQVLNKLLFPPVWLTVLLTMVSAGGLAAVFGRGWDEHPVGYAVYVLAFYTLCVVCAFCVKVLPPLFRRTKQEVYAHPVGNRYMTDVAFKARVSLYLSLGINLAYCAFKLVLGVVYSSLWWGAVAVYYILLALLRFLLLRRMRAAGDGQEPLGEWRSYRLCGVLLLVLNLSLSGIVFQMVWQNKGFAYPGVMIFAAAAYTFYSVAISVVDLVRYRKYQSPVLSASKAIRFAAALVSLLSLETAMLAQFGQDEVYSQIMTACTGAGVCIVVLTVSVYMIARSGKEMRKLLTDQKE